jgi:hypothetical protein
VQQRPSRHRVGAYHTSAAGAAGTEHLFDATITIGTATNAIPIMVFMDRTLRRW